MYPVLLCFEFRSAQSRSDMKETLKPRRSTPVEPRQSLKMLRDLFPLLMLGGVLFFSNSRFTLIDDEALVLESAAQPVIRILGSFRSVGLDNYSLWHLLLHFWLFVTGGALDWLRVPSILCYLLGLWLLSRTALRVAGEESGNSLIWLGVLWPYGFHFGRLASPYSFVFLLISALIWAHLRYLASPDRAKWLIVLLLGLALIYTSYLGWALLAFVGLDCWLRNRNKKPVGKGIFGTALILAVAYVPLWATLARDLAASARLRQPFKAASLNAGYNLYVLFASESMAPWFWRFGVPIAIAVAACLVLIFLSVRGESRRYLTFGVLLLLGMASIGILQPRRLLFVAPWFLLSLAVVLGTVEKWQWRGPLAVSLAVITGLGWYGTTTRRYYAASPFLEPWEQVANEAAAAARSGGGVVGSGEVFFFYLTYALKAPPADSPWHFAGSLPTQVTYPQVWSPEQWESAGRPLPSALMWVRGLSSQQQNEAMENAGDRLSQQCGERITRYMVRESEWTERFYPEPGQAPWRIEIRQYSCGQPSTTPSTPGQ